MGIALYQVKTFLNKMCINTILGRPYRLIQSEINSILIYMFTFPIRMILTLASNQLNKHHFPS